MKKSRLDPKVVESLDWSLVDPFSRLPRIPPDFFLIAHFFFFLPLLKLFCLFPHFLFSSPSIFFPYSLFNPHSLFFVLARPLSKRLYTTSSRPLPWSFADKPRISLISLHSLPIVLKVQPAHPAIGHAVTLEDFQSGLNSFFIRSVPSIVPSFRQFRTSHHHGCLSA